MAQLPFTFSGKGPRPPKAEPKAPEHRAPGPKVLTVTELERSLKLDLEERYSFVLVAGEISNFQIHSASGHAYFTLKDKAAAIKCVMWRDHFARLRSRPEDGQEVIVRGRVTVYERAGTLQLSVVHIEPQGLGALQAEFQALVEKLKREGLTSPERKRPIPTHPRTLGVVTSPDGAALRDILRTILRRDPRAHVLFSFTSVQGREATASIVKAIRRLDRCQDVEVVILARGGGSLEDLWCFNEEAVARAIAGARVPVVTGVGHETDTTIADLVADVRTSTPTAAAEHVTPVRHVEEDAWRRLEARLERAMQARLATAARDLWKLSNRLRDPTATLRSRAQDIDELATRGERAIRARLRQALHRLRALEQLLARRDPIVRQKTSEQRLSTLDAQRDAAMEAYLRRARARLDVATAKLESLNPTSVLARGFAIVLDGDGRLVSNPRAAKPNDRLTIQLASGRIAVTVLEIEDAPGPAR